MPGPLHDIRVVEIASFVAVPSAGTLLADLGAEVIKVEVPGGEVMRTATPHRSGFFGSDFPESPAFHMDNRGKRSLTLDLTRPAALKALGRVIAGADVVLTNLLPQRQRRFGLDAGTLRAAHPRLVYASLSGFGSDGPDRERPAFDYTAFWARTGFMDLMHDEGLRPSWMRGGVGDHSAGLALVCGILAALRTRDATGEGQVVEVSLMHVGLHLLGNDTAPALATGRNPPRHDRTRPRNPLWNQYRTRDDRWLFLVMPEERYWPEVCRAFGCEELTDDPRFSGAKPRYMNSTELVARFDAIVAERTLADWEAHLTGFDVIWAPVRTIQEALQDPQARAAGMIAQIDSPTTGHFDTVAPPLRMSGHPMPADRPAPALGADTEAVLREAGLGPDEIAEALRS